MYELDSFITQHSYPSSNLIHFWSILEKDKSDIIRYLKDFSKNLSNPQFLDASSTCGKIMENLASKISSCPSRFKSAINTVELEIGKEDKQYVGLNSIKLKLEDLLDEIHKISIDILRLRDETNRASFKYKNLKEISENYELSKEFINLRKALGGVSFVIRYISYVYNFLTSLVNRKNRKLTFVVFAIFLVVITLYAFYGNLYFKFILKSVRKWVQPAGSRQIQLNI